MTNPVPISRGKEESVVRRGLSETRRGREMAETVAKQGSCYGRLNITSLSNMPSALDSAFKLHIGTRNDGKVKGESDN